MTDKTTPTIGRIIEGETPPRDAIHFAVVPIVAMERLRPGEDVGVHKDVAGRILASSKEAFIGIVDPFLQRPVAEGQRFWLFLYPNTITSLRHDWTHPAFL